MPLGYSKHTTRIHLEYSWGTPRVPLEDDSDGDHVDVGEELGQLA